MAAVAHRSVTNLRKVSHSLSISRKASKVSAPATAVVTAAFRPSLGLSGAPGIVAALDLVRPPDADRQRHEEDQPPKDDEDDDPGKPGHQACSISISVPQKSFGCRNRTGLPCAPIAGSPLPRDTGSRLRQRIPGGQDVVHLVADMVHAPGGVLLQEAGNRGLFAERLQQFDLGVGQFDEDDGYAVLRQGLRGRDPQAPERAPVGAGSRFQVRHGDGDMVQAADHRDCPPSMRMTWTSTSGRRLYCSRTWRRMALRTASSTVPSSRRCMPVSLPIALVAEACQFRGKIRDLVLDHDAPAGHGRLDQSPASAVQHDRRRDDALLRKAPPGPDMLRIERDQATAVQAEPPHTNLAETLHACLPAIRSSDAVLDLGNGPDTAFAREPRMGAEMVQFPVDGNRRFRPYPLIHAPQFCPGPDAPTHARRRLWKSRSRRPCAGIGPAVWRRPSHCREWCGTRR